MTTDRSGPGHPYQGCRTFVSETGMCGMALGSEGSRAGALYDVFASPYENPGALYGLMELACDLGGDHLMTFHLPLTIEFFEHAGFRVAARMRAESAPEEWIPEACKSATGGLACPDFVSMVRVRQVSPEAKSWMEKLSLLPQGGRNIGWPDGPCAICGSATPGAIRLPFIGGYKCTRCGFICVSGTLTMGVPDTSGESGDRMPPRHFS